MFSRLMNGKIVIILFMAAVTFSIQCNRHSLSGRENTPEEQYEEAKRIFDKKDYYKAKMQFTVIVLNNPGHRIIEKAQYYLAESHYHLDEYIQAIAEYEKLIRSMPQSPFVDDARFKVGLCYYDLSPGYALDQEYTQKAIYQFQLFLEEYPNSEVRPEVEKKLAEARDKLAKKEFKTGELYKKMGYNEAAIISFNAVLEEYHDTQYADDALFLKGECHLKLNAFSEAIQSYDALIDRYPDSEHINDARDRMNQAREKQSKMKLSTKDQD
ncbi:outer membrane protein assembly factor BamD [bacterium]|nr:outer membrane protein assembly factor BamD [bacterium]